MQKMNNFKLIVILFVLAMVGLSLQLLLRKKDRISDLKEVKTAFPVTNIETVDKVKVMGKQNLDFTYKTDKRAWYVNDSICVDKDDISKMMTLLSQVTPSREITGNDSLKNAVLENGIKVDVFGNRKFIKGYIIGSPSTDDFGNYVMKKGEDKLYVAGLSGLGLDMNRFFSVNPKDLKDRYLIASSPKTIQKIALSINGKTKLTILANDNFYSVNGISKLDSAKLYGYLKMYNRIKCSFIFEPSEDSLKGKKVFSNLIFEDADASKNTEIVFYEPNQNMMIGYIKNKDYYFKVKWSSMKWLFALPKDFEKEKEKPIQNLF